MRRAYTIAIVSFVVALPLLMAPTGGIPSRPRFQSVGVNVAAPATGNLTASGTITAATVNATSALQLNGTPLAAPIACVDAACSIATLAVGQTAIVVKTSATARTSTTTLAADPVLTFTNAPNGAIYLLEAFVKWTQGGATTNGIRAALTGTSFTSSHWCRVTTNTSTANASEVANGTDAQGFLTFTDGGASASANRQITCSGVGTTSAGSATLDFRWAQNTSSASATTVAAQSVLRATRVQ